MSAKDVQVTTDQAMPNAQHQPKLFSVWAGAKGYLSGLTYGEAQAVQAGLVKQLEAAKVKPADTVKP